MMMVLTPGQLAHIEEISSRELAKRLLDGRSAGAAFVACSEMGSAIPCVPHEPAESIFVRQNLGGCLGDDGVLEGLIRNKKISDVIIFGHYPCALIDLMLNDNAHAAKMSKESLAYCHRQCAEIKRSLEQQFGLSRDDHNHIRVMKKASEERVLWQLSQVTHLLCSGNLSKQQTRLHGWLWIEEELLSFDPKKGTFLPTCEV